MLRAGCASCASSFMASRLEEASLELGGTSAPAGSAPFPRQPRNVVKETHFQFAVSKELLQTAPREETDKGRVGNVPVLHRGHTTIIPGASPLASSRSSCSWH